MPKTIGEILKNQRLDRKLSLDDAAGSTHIRYKYLEALENDHFDLLPSSVQGRGFLRAYAEFLELDPTPLLKHWETRTPVLDEPEQTRHAEKVQKINRPEKPFIEQAESPDIYAEVEPDDSSSLQTEVGHPGETIQQPPEADPPVIEVISPVAESGKSAAHFLAVSSILRNQREILGLSLSDIEQYTHIRQFYLQAIEEGRFQDLPSPVQAKGMIENYAQFLDINSDELMLEYAEGLQAQREEKLALENPPPRSGMLPLKRPAKAAAKPAGKAMPGKLLTPDLIIGSFVIIFLVAFAIWTTGRVIASRNSQSRATIPGISDVLVSTASPVPETSTATAPMIVSTLDLNASAAETEPVETEIVEETGQPAGTDVSTDLPEVVFDENAPIHLNIVINQRTYLKVIADNETVFEGRSQPGNAYPYSAAESIEVIAGNAAALQIIYNEVDMGVIGSFGELVNLVFKGGVVMTPTPQFSPSPTGTQAPTMTLQVPTATVTPTVTPYIP